MFLRQPPKISGNLFATLAPITTDPDTFATTRLGMFRYVTGGEFVTVRPLGSLMPHASTL